MTDKIELTVKEIAEMMRLDIDEYMARKSTRDELRDKFLLLAEETPGKIFEGDSNFKNTFIWVLGKKRLQILTEIYQGTKFELRGEE